ncbi:MAG: hypothetical protein K0B81_01240 [Candidatus Cloacimonetes bacterium]|nr:hypothetical protein [Candidatus Cloacimonadota bacterium]
MNLPAVDLTLNTSAIQNATNGLIFLAQSPSGTILNPAYLHQGLESGVTYLFSFTDLPYYTLHLSSNRNNWGFYLGGCHLAHPLYKESSLNLTINYRKNFYAVGSSLRLMHNRVSDYHNAHAFIGDAGLIIYYDKITSGFSIKNLTQTRFQGHTLPVVVIWEINYSLSNNSSLSLGLEKERNYDFSFKTAAYYRLHPYIAILSSYQYEPDRIGAGVKLLPSPLRITYSILTHRYLSPTHYFSLAYEFSN